MARRARGIPAGSRQRGGDGETRRDFTEREKTGVLFLQEPLNTILKTFFYGPLPLPADPPGPGDQEDRQGAGGGGGGAGG